MILRTSREGIALIKRFEGCRLLAYRDVVGVWTIGYGHTSMAGPPTVTPGLQITQQEADDILVADLVKYETAVDRALTRPSTQAQFDACVSLCYNIGQGAFAGSSVVRKFGAGDILGAADAFLLWDKAGGRPVPGLAARRAAERKLFLSSLAAPPPQPQPQPPRPVPVPPAPIPPPAPETPPAAPAAPARTGSIVARVMVGIAAALVAAFAAWKLRG